MRDAEETSAGDKDHDPTSQKLEKAREQGDVARSADLLAAASYLGLLAGCFAAVDLVSQAAVAGKVFLEQAPALARLASPSSRPMIDALMQTSLAPAAVFLGFPAIFVLLAAVAQRALVFSPDKLAPRLNRISVLDGARKKFGPDGLFDFCKSLLKLTIVTICLSWLLRNEADRVLSTAALAPAQGLLVLFNLLALFAALVVVVTAGIGGIDLLWQRHALMRRNRMSRKEVLDEAKDNEGDPHTKGLRRQRAQDIALNQMLADVPKANVVIVNPTHYAVALVWTRGARTAPIVVAKGVDETARRIREIAAEHGVPLYSNPAAARALYATVPVGQPIPRDQFRAAAAAIRFAEAMRQRVRRYKA